MDIQSSVKANQQLFNKLAQQESSEPALPQRAPSNYADKVSLSYQGDKMKAISREFFSGTIHSSQIPALTQRLYEEGFISGEEFKQLGGAQQEVPVLSEASAFVNKWALEALQNQDPDTAQQVIKVADALANVNLQSTPARRQAEAEAYDIMSRLAQQYQQEGADSTKLEGINKVLDVLSALAKVRNSEQANGAVLGYEQVEKAYDELFAQDSVANRNN